MSTSFEIVLEYLSTIKYNLFMLHAFSAFTFIISFNIFNCNRSHFKNKIEQRPG